MNRRTFVTSLASSLALIGVATDVTAQRKRPVISKLTDAEIDFGNTNFEFDDHRVSITGSNQVETVSLSSDHAHLNIHFIMWKPRLDPVGHYDDLIDQLEADPDVRNIQGLGVNSLPDGAWMAYSHENEKRSVSTYWEIQLDAFADQGVDLWVELHTFDHELEASLADTQEVTIAGLPPLLFMEDSSIAAGLFAPVEEVNSATRLTNSLRGSRSETTNTAGTGDVVEDVRAHQQQFKGEVDDLYAALDTVAAGATGKEEADAITTVFGLGVSWQGYPATARSVQFSADLQSLEIVYVDWADAVGVLGTTLLGVLSGEASADDFGIAMEAVNTADRKLAAELRNLGVFPDSNSNINSHLVVASILRESAGRLA